MSNIVSEPSTPGWANRLILRIQAAFVAAATPTNPVKIAAYADPTKLPPASGFPPQGGQAGIVFVTSISRIAASDGKNWLRMDTGAVIG